jgi:hypothetical protein
VPHPNMAHSMHVNRTSSGAEVSGTCSGHERSARRLEPPSTKHHPSAVYAESWGLSVPFAINREILPREKLARQQMDTALVDVRQPFGDLIAYLLN